MKLKPASKPWQRLILVSSALPQAWTRSRRSRSPPSPRPAVSSRQWPVRWHRVCQGRLSPSCSRQPRWRWGSTSCRCGRSPRMANTPCPPTASPAAPTVGLGLLTSSWLPLLPQLSSQGCKAAKRSVVSSWLSVYQVIFHVSISKVLGVFRFQGCKSVGGFLLSTPAAFPGGKASVRKALSFLCPWLCSYKYWDSLPLEVTCSKCEWFLWRACFHFFSSDQQPLPAACQITKFPWCSLDLVKHDSVA